jgi:hypothetical protein
MITDFTGGQITPTNVICDPMSAISGADSTGLNFVVNTGCFANPTRLGEIGNSPRNGVRMPSIFNNDLALFKNIKLGERREVQLRWEVYNIFNHTNFRDIDAALMYGVVQINPGGSSVACTAAGNTCTAVVRQTRATFGTPTSARSPRVMQGSIRINF